MFFLKLITHRTLKGVTPLVTTFQRGFRFQISCLYARTFNHFQNDYGRNVLMSIPAPNMLKLEELSPFLQKPAPERDSLTQILASKDWKSCSTEELYAGLESVATYCREYDLQISETCFDEIIDAFADRRHEFSDEILLDLLKLLMILPTTPSKNTRNYWDLWLAIEDVCLARVRSWDLGKRLLYVDHFHSLGLGKTSKLTHNVVMRMGRNIPKLPKDLFLQLLFFLNVTRDPIDEMIDIEKNWIHSMDDMTIEEVGVVCTGLFKTKTRIRDIRVLKKLYAKLHRHLDTVDSMTLSNILKQLEYSTKAKETYLVIELLDALTPHIHRFHLVSCLHIGTLGTDMQQCHEPSLKLVIQRFYNEFENARLKDLERIAFIIGLFDFKMPDGLERKLMEKIVNELDNRVDEVARYPSVFINLVHYLSIIDPTFVTPDMISLSLNPDFLIKAFGKNSFNLGSSAVSLDSFAEIYYGDAYKGNRMSKQRKNFICGVTLDYEPYREKRDKLTHGNKMLLEIVEGCEEVFGFAKMFSPLPHFQRLDVILAVDSDTKKAIDIRHNFPEKMNSTILTRDILLQGVKEKDRTKLFALVIAGHNNVLRGTDKVTGYVRTKVWQLEKRGFEVLVINWRYWPTDLRKQKEYLKQVIEQKLGN
ncbi:FAST kinase domain-containing protein 5, mitochondrial-like [Culicoides brevitarsis]|uniref:FAST kinase domain-containing protein 5, mitochondrial-like n=1 Tax=Culicoides brevitarsis TaxID=469753 RepID=UPI00307B4C3E